MATRNTEQQVQIEANIRSNISPSDFNRLVEIAAVYLPKCYLPKIDGQAAARVVYDATIAAGTAAVEDSLVKLIDPTSEHRVPLLNVDGELIDLPADITTSSQGGKTYFSDLPFVLRSRLSYDEANKTLGFKGTLNGEGQVGDPQLLPNIMTAFEKERIENLPGADADFITAIEKLYNLTRNPDGLVNETGSDKIYRVGLQALNELRIAGYQDGDGITKEHLKGGIGIDENGDGVAESFIDADGDKRDDRLDQLEEGWQVIDDDKTVAVPEALLGRSDMALTAGHPTGTGYVTLAFNDDKSLGSLVSLQVIKVGNPPDSCDVYQGNIWIVPSDNIFEEKLTLRHTGDFAGDPDNVLLEWWYQPDSNGQPFAPEGTPGLGWSRFPGTDVPGALDITIENKDASSALMALSDNWFITRYTGLNACDNNALPTPVPSAWAGDPSQPADAPKGMLAMGWIKRVIGGLNPFDARTDDFHNNEVSTLTSMISLAGEAYTGPIPFNPDPDVINEVGIIEAYQTVFERGEDLSINQGHNDIAANTQLLNVSTRIADLYMLLGNEAYADAQDPTIGFDTGSELGSLASSIFTFQNQLNSPLEEELVLLRGRDDTRAGVAGAPVYNRLFWNFTQGNGEVAYVQSYGITDHNKDGFITEIDARIRYPQGHGDAWGHYLTSVKTRYSLLQEQNFTWVPRAESVLVANSPIEIDYLDERKFAQAAAAKARAGAEIVNLTYREKYVEDPKGQWQGYKDTETNKDRAWGLDGWGRRAGQGAYFDWVTANAILPAEDPDPAHEGIDRVDRTTVVELAQIVSGFNNIQSQVDQADAGLNPLGLAKGVVPFDIDPNFLEVGSGNQGESHFDQIAARAQKTLDNAITVFDYVNQQTQSLRNVQDDVDQLERLVLEQEMDYKHRLIEIFGYPYAGDMGGGKTYPSDYNGPDIYHYMYVNSDVIGDLHPPNSSFTGFFTPITMGGESDFVFPSDSSTNFNNVQTLKIGEEDKLVSSVNYPVVTGAGWDFVAPDAWGHRQAPGELQTALSDMLQAKAQLQRALKEHANLLKEVDDAVDLMNAEYDLQEETIRIQKARNIAIGALNAARVVAKTAEVSFAHAAETTDETAKILTAGIPRVVGVATDAFSAVRGAAWGVSGASKLMFLAGAGVAEGTEFGLDLATQLTELTTETSLVADTTNVDLVERIKDLEQLWRQEPVLRLELYTQAEIVKQSFGRYQEILARGGRLLDERATFRTLTAGDTQQYRYRDMTFRIFRNDALQKYRAQFDLAARYIYLAAVAYDYETNLLGGETGSGRKFLADIVRQRSLGQVIDGVPVAGTPGLADVLARLLQNFDVYRGQLGFNNPQIETNRFSLRYELFRKRLDPEDPDSEGDLLAKTKEQWRKILDESVKPNLWDIPEFRRYVRPFAAESQGPQPGLVIRFPTSVNFGRNFFGHKLSGGDSAYDPSNFATKIRAVGTWFSNYDGSSLSNTPRVYLVPVGMDVLRSPSDDSLATREWRVIDQKLPAPFPIGASDLSNPDWIPMNDSLSGTYADIRRHSSYRAYHDSGAYDPAEVVSDSRLIGRSVWNTDWMLIIPGGTLLYDPDEGLERFIHGQLKPDSTERDGNGIEDILLHFQTYGYSGN